MFDEMKRFAPLLLSLALFRAHIFAAEEAPATTDQAFVEDFKRLVGRVQDLEESLSAQQRRNADLKAEVESLRTALRETTETSSRKMADAVTREEVNRFAQKLQEVDQKRESDKKTILEEIRNLENAVTKKLETLAAAPASRPSNTGRGSRNSERQDAGTEKKTLPQGSGEVYPYKVKKNESLSEIIAAYNGVFKAQGKGTITLDQVRKANPKININKIYEGQEILIPAPAEKK